MAIATNVSIPQYAEAMANAIPGMLFGTNEHVVLTKQAKDDEIVFGAPLFATAADAHKMTAKDATKALPFVGIAGFTQKTAGCYEKDEPLNCVVKGYICININGTIDEGEEVYVKYADGTFVSATAAAAGTSGDYVAINAKSLDKVASNSDNKAVIRILLG